MVMPPFQPPIDPVTGMPLQHMMPDGTIMDGPPMDGPPPMDPSMMMPPPPPMDPGLMPPPPSDLQTALGASDLPTDAASEEPPAPEEPPLPPLPPLYVPPVGNLFGEPDSKPGAPDIPEPKYDPGYVKPPKPDPATIKEEADSLWHKHRFWRSMIATTLKWISQDLTGMFPEDEEDRAAGLQEEFISSALSDEFNLMVSKLASLEPEIRKPLASGYKKAQAYALEDAATWLLKRAETRHAWTGNRPWRMDVSALFLAYGMAVSRQTLFPADYEYPLRVTLIDPTQVYPVWGANGLQKVYRVYRDTMANIIHSYGDSDPALAKKLEAKYGMDWRDESEVNVVEYWDTWWRCVLIDDMPVLAVTAHEYGYVPYTIQYAGLGEPMFTTLPSDGGATRMGTQWVTTHVSRADERVRKALPAIYYRIRSHQMREAIIARLVTGFKKEINPPLIRYRSNMAAEKSLPTLDAGPGMQNEAMLGEERIEPFPVITNTPVTSVILSQLFDDEQTGGMPAAAFGQVDKSNVTGAALSQLYDAGMDKLVPHVKGLEYFISHQVTQSLRTIRNFGHLACYCTLPAKPLLIPVKRAGKGVNPVMVLDAALIDAVGEEVEVRFNLVDHRDWLQLFNAGQLGVQAGFVTRAQIIQLAHGTSNFDRFYEEWAEEDALFKTVQHPKFAEVFQIPMSIMAQMQEVRDDPRMVRYYEQMLDGWMNLVVRSSAKDAQGQEAQMDMTLQQMRAPAPPPSTTGADLTGLGMGPGSQGGAVGRPGQQ